MIQKTIYFIGSYFSCFVCFVVIIALLIHYKWALYSLCEGVEIVI